MNKFKAWLIRKLGGCVYLEQSQKIVYKTIPFETVKADVQLPPVECHINDVEAMEIVSREAARQIGDFIVKNNLCDVQRTYDSTFNREIARFTIRVTKGVD